MKVPEFEFFVILLDPASGKLRLPERFAGSLEGREPRQLKLREAGDGLCASLVVEVVFNGWGEMFLGLGWEQFAHSYDLQIGHLLVFSFDGVDMLTVKVFDGEMCRRKYLYDDASSDIGVDDFCVFTKGVKVGARQKAVLKDFFDQNQPKIPLYICKIMNSHIDHAKGQMYFNPEYTKDFLASAVTTEPADVKVYYNNNEKMTAVRMKIGEKKTAIMTRGWVSITNEQKWKVGDILMFCFQHDGKNKLNVLIKKV